MRISRISTIVGVALFCGPLAASAALPDDDPAHGREPTHHRELHRSQKHPAGIDANRFFTNRDAPPLPLPGEDDAFFFAIFGDRTGGVPAGLKFLRQAVVDVNLLEPDLVMTVGDLVQGYNTTDRWLEEMREFKGIMSALLCPWFPVAGNHDIYWQGPNRPEGQHERDYEMHFGPLWYAFEHKDSWFVVLYSDEGNPATGEKSFNKPAAQRMSEEQFTWLEETLDRTKHGQHTFVFLHHPRWLKGGYGDDWDRVHTLLADSGNVRAVFAGHIHRMHYAGVQDGIEYVTLATTGGVQSGAVPEAGYLDHYHIVTVRPNQIAMAAMPVGEVMDVRAITGEVSDDTRRLARLSPTFSRRVTLHADGSVDERVQVTLRNPVRRPIELTLTPDSADSRWLMRPDHVHHVIKPGESIEIDFNLTRRADGIDDTFAAAHLVQQIDYLAAGRRFSIPARDINWPLTPDLAAPAPGSRALMVDGSGDALAVPSSMIKLPDGPLTIECRFKARSLASRVGLINKTEDSEYGLLLDGGVPRFLVLLGDKYVNVTRKDFKLSTDRWHHIAGVYDGNESRLYVDGELIASVKRSGRRRTNNLPLLIGADVAGGGRGMSYFDGWIDAVHVSSFARYTGRRIEPVRRPLADEHTRLLLNMDAMIGPWAFDESAHAAHPTKRGDAQIVEISRD